MTKVTIDNIDRYGCFSVKKQEIVTDHALFHDLPIERRAFCPGEFKELEAYAPELMEQAKEIWTEEKIAAWKEEQKQYAL